MELLASHRIKLSEAQRGKVSYDLLKASHFDSRKTQGPFSSTSMAALFRAFPSPHIIRKVRFWWIYDLFFLRGAGGGGAEGILTGD